MFKIEALVDGNWTSDGVGPDNSFETEEEALEMIPELARIFQCGEDEFIVSGANEG